MNNSGINVDKLEGINRLFQYLLTRTMIGFRSFIWIALILPLLGVSQPESVLITSEVLEGKDAISIGALQGWYYKSNADITDLQNFDDISGWQPLNFNQISIDMADSDGHIEGWFKLNLQIDSGLELRDLGIKWNGWGAAEFFVDGNHVATFGQIEPFHEYNPFKKYPIPIQLDDGKKHQLAVHYFDRIMTFPMRSVRDAPSLNQHILLTGSRYLERIEFEIQNSNYFILLWILITGIAAFLLLLISILNRRERNLWFLSLTAVLFFLLAITQIDIANPDISSKRYVTSMTLLSLLLYMILIATPIILARIFQYPIKKWLIIILAVNGLTGILEMATGSFLLRGFSFILTIVLIILITAASWQRLRGAQWVIVGGYFFATILALIQVIVQFVFGYESVRFTLTVATFIFISLPISFLIYISLRYKEILNEVIAVSEEKEEILTNQNTELEKQVAERTEKLKKSLEELKATQAQLIQTEKMASLGELTAGIAHEIQNPLNFVNNFSELNEELIQELRQELESGNPEEVKELLEGLVQNEEKIKFHGKRAEGIVKSMLHHSRESSGQKELTDLNLLCDEYLRLAYHGMRAKDKTFNAQLITDFDDQLPKIEVVQQDIGRVLLNLFNNAFQALNDAEQPKLKVTTINVKGAIEISITDNGPGIPDEIKNKIFQPFFTTKPTGQGTGLGLSLAYDIVKAHGGKIKVESEKGKGSIFKVYIPSNGYPA